MPFLMWRECVFVTSVQVIYSPRVPRFFSLGSVPANHSNRVVVFIGMLCFIPPLATGGPGPAGVGGSVQGNARRDRLFRRSFGHTLRKRGNVPPCGIHLGPDHHDAQSPSCGAFYRPRQGRQRRRSGVQGDWTSVLLWSVVQGWSRKTKIMVGYLILTAVLNGLDPSSPVDQDLPCNMALANQSTHKPIIDRSTP